MGKRSAMVENGDFYELRSGIKMKVPEEHIKARKERKLRLKTATSEACKLPIINITFKEVAEYLPSSYEEDLREAEADMIQYAELGLKHFNEVNKAKGGPEYVLMETIGCQEFLMRRWWCHENFKAKPKGACDDEARLFFAELKNTGCADDDFEATNCCILEPHDLVGPGLNGCQACQTLPSVRHPVSGFNVGSPPYRFGFTDTCDLELARKVAAALSCDK